ncbi:MAG: sulfatase-like hydrolase/transferase, partial [Legionella sp.]
MPRKKKPKSFTSRFKSFLLNPITPIISLLVSYIVIRNQQMRFHPSSGTTLTDFNQNGMFDDANNFERFIFNHNTEHILTDDYPLEDYLIPDEPINIDDPSGPEILITMIDDVGASTLTEESYITSPNIKEFIRSGTTIAGGVRAYPTCTPSRAAFLSGRQPATPQAALGGYPFPAIYPGPPTLIDMLHKRGFYVIQGGKWHLGHAMNAYMPNGGFYGIDYFFGKLQGGGQHMSDKNGCFPLLNGLDMFRLYKNGSVEVICDKDLVNIHSTDFYADEIIKQIRVVRQENPKQRIAVLFTPQAAHSPTAVSQMNPVDYETCSHLTNPTSRGFCSMVESVARNHLRIVAALEETSIAPPLKKSVIEVIFSDNGGKPTSGADNCVRHSTICYRGGKSSIWEGGMRVPGIFKGPNIPENKIVDTLFHVTDIYPTLKGLLDDYWGIETPAIPG